MKTSTPRDAVQLSPNAVTVLEKRYLVKDDGGRPVEAPSDLFWRVARTVAEADRRYGATDQEVEQAARDFYDMMAGRLFMPNSPTLMNAGRPLGQLSACFVLPVDDALSNGKSGIYDTLRAMALVHQSGGGTGFSFSRLRPKNDIVRSTMGVASGPVSFMSLFDASTDVVKQGGTRRGANMGILRVDHPDIMEFVTCKDDTTKITNFNISVAVTDAFMAAVEADTAYDLIHPKTGQVTGQLQARTVWERIIHGAWKTGEPGVFFVDKANYYNPVPHLGSYESTNPCGEQPLLPYDVCNLGSINLGAFVKESPRAERGDEASIDWDRLRRVVHVSTHFLENVIDANQYPLSEITELAQHIRRIGLGVMGLADLFVRLGIAYDSDEGVALGRKIQQFVDEEAKVESERLAGIRGTFPEWAQSIWGPDESAARGPDGERVRPMRKLRNCNVTTVAPTGTISIIANCSSGIEPLFAVAFMRNQAGVLMPDVNEDFVAIARKEGWYSEDLMRKIAEAGHINFDEVPEKWRRVFVTANHIKPEWHIRMQAAFQEFNDSAISKTCNFANDATESYVEEIYRLAYKLNCKGVTVYRDGSRDMQVLSTGSTAKKVQEQATSTGKAEARADLVASQAGTAGNRVIADLRGELAEVKAENARLHKAMQDLEAENLQRRQKRSRPETLRGTTRRVETPLGTLYVNITEDDRGQPFEVFMSLGKAGGALMADVEALGRLISLALRSGISMREVWRQLRGISSDRVIGLGPNKVLSVPDAVGIAVERWMLEKQGIQQELLPRQSPPSGVPVAEIVPTMSAARFVEGSGGEQIMLGGMQETLSGACPDCGSQLEYAEGCVKCHVCGYSECG